MTKIDLADAAYVAFQFRNDLHYLHHHIVGENFDELHELFGEYYDKVLEDFDYFSEHAIAGGQELQNMNNVSSTKIGNLWSPIPYKKQVDWKEASEWLDKKGGDYLDMLDMLRENDMPDDIASDIDSMHSFWRTEVQYKNAQRLGRSGGAAYKG